MSSILAWLAYGSFIAFLAVSIHLYAKSKNITAFVTYLFFLSIFGVVLYFRVYLPGGVVGKGAGKDLAFIIVLYGFMVAGMLANYLYARFSKPKYRRKKFDFGVFISPVLVSPIVFIPLYAAFKGAQIDLDNLSGGKMMVFLVAFQNGFFWKEFFDNAQKETKAVAKSGAKKKKKK